MSTLLARDTGHPVDFERMRRDRFQRVLEAMERRDLDVLLAGKPANARYITGANTNTNIAGARGFSPSVVVVRERREFHIMTWWDAGVPVSVPRERLFPISWNPANTIENLKRLFGSAKARRIGVDLLSPLYAGLLSQAFPHAAIANGEAALLEARAVKTPDEIECLRTAIAISEGALATAIASLRPGTSERALLGIFEKAATAYGVTYPVSQGGFCVQPLHGEQATPPLRFLVDERPVRSGDLATISGGFSYMGYDADIGRTWLCDAAPSSAHKALFARWRAACDAMLDECLPGRTAAGIHAAYAKAEPGVAPQAPIAHGSGMGIEPPLVGASLGETVERSWSLAPGMVVTLQPYVWQRGVGGILAKETVLITTSGPQRLTRLSHGPLGG
jgi:Xaa-Pro aminopeptidase